MLFDIGGWLGATVNDCSELTRVIGDVMGYMKLFVCVRGGGTRADKEGTGCFVETFLLYW